MKRVGLVARADSPAALSTAKRLAATAEKRGVQVAYESETARELKVKAGELRNLDLVIILGGDGTVLRTIRKLNRQTPVIAFNAGTVGFMSEAPLNEAPNLLEKALRGEGRVEKCTRLQCTHNGRKLRPGLNDVLLLSSDLSKVIHIQAKKGRTTFFEGVADGAMISTRVGSTAYSMAVGGPILDPGVDAFIFNTLYAVRIAVRPLILPVTAEISLILKDPSREGYLIVDGENEGKVRRGDRIIIRRAPEPASFLRLRENFYQRLHRRMSLEV